MTKTSWPRVVDAETVERRFSKLERRLAHLFRAMVVLALCLAAVGFFVYIAFQGQVSQSNARFCATAEQAAVNARAADVPLDPLLPAAAEALRCPKPIDELR